MYAEQCWFIMLAVIIVSGSASETTIKSLTKQILVTFEKEVYAQRCIQFLTAVSC
jgi:UDP-N-acetylmuramyl pentapeptide synthase